MSNKTQQSQARKKLLAAIHVAKKQLALDDLVYQDIVRGVSGQESCKELTIDQLNQVLNRFNELGWKPPQYKPRKNYKYQPAPDKQALWDKMVAMLTEFNLPMTYADGMAQQMFKIKSARWLNAQQLYRLVQALAVFQKRQQKKRNAK